MVVLLLCKRPTENVKKYVFVICIREENKKKFIMNIDEYRDLGPRTQFFVLCFSLNIAQYYLKGLDVRLYLTKISCLNIEMYIHYKFMMQCKHLSWLLLISWIFYLVGEAHASLFGINSKRSVVFQTLNPI